MTGHSIAPLTFTASAAGLELDYWQPVSAAEPDTYLCTTVSWRDRVGLWHTHRYDFDAGRAGAQCPRWSGCWTSDRRLAPSGAAPPPSAARVGRDRQVVLTSLSRNSPVNGPSRVCAHMLTNLRGIRRSTLGCAAALLLIAPAAQAAAPEPCDGKLLVKDAAGDAAYKQQGTVLFPGPANADATGLFFRSDEGKLTANVVIADLTKTLPTGFQAVRYRVYVTVGGSVKYLQALLTSSGVAYTYGSQLQAVYTKNGDTTGAFHEGKNGVVQIVVPAAIAKTGTKMDAISVSNGLLTAASAPEEGQLPPVYFGLDTAPDGASSTVTTTAPADCPPPPAPPAPPAEAPAAPPAEAPAPPAPAAAPSGPVLGEPFQAKGDLRMSLAKSKLSARKVKRRLRLSLRSNERLTFATVKLQRGWRVLSRLDLDVLGARTTLKMKLGRRLARRAHTLIVRGTLPDGTMATQRLRLRITR